MNQQSSIEFELAQSTDGILPLPKGSLASEGTASEGTASKATGPDSSAGEPTAAKPTALIPPSDQPALIGHPAGSAAKKLEVDSSEIRQSASAGSTPRTSGTDSPAESKESAAGTKAKNALAGKPLKVDEHNTVISTQLKAHEEPIPAQLNASAEELQNRLFGSRADKASGSGSIRVGNMDVFEKIGSGGMGAVFRAVDTELSREVALKVLHPRVSLDPALVARFRNEARACAQLNHDNIARVFNAGDHDGVHYIAYEYAAGKTIKELIQERGQLTTAETVNYAIQATLALGHIESAGIIHRDIKPSNIILTNSGRIKVVDLGLARRETEDSIADLTVAGTTLGTFDYLAPEQARDARAADIRSDIYSLGCTLYHMLAGCPPYPDGTAVQKMLDHQGKEPPDIRQKNKSVPKVMAAIVQRMMTTSPEDRYQAPGQLLADLIDLATHMGLRSVPAEGIVWRRVPVTKVRDISGSLFLAGAIAVICVTALIMHFLPANSNSDGTPSDLQWLSEATLPRTDQSSTEPNPATPTGVKPNSENDDSAALAATDTSPGVDDGGTTVEIDGAAEDPKVAANAVIDSLPFLVLSSNGETRYRSLAEAWNMAVDGDIIELDFDGPAPAITNPLPRRSVGPATSPRIAIRAARDRKPVIVFGVSAEANSSTSQGRFFALGGDLQLEVTGIHFRVDLAEATQLDDWTLFDFNGVNRVRMSRCTVDVKNPSQIPLSLFRLRNGGLIAPTADIASVVLDGVAVRGSTDLVRLQAQLDSEIVLDQSGFALDGCLLRNLGSAEMLRQGSVTLSMNQCTTITSQPVIMMKDSELLDLAEPERVLPKVNVLSYSNVFASLMENGTLVAMQGNSFGGVPQELLTWDGINNYYSDRLQVFWEIESGVLATDLVQVDFDTWQSDWNRQRDTQETYPQIFDAEAWVFPELLKDRSPVLLNELPVKAFELKSTLFSSSGEAKYSLEKGEQLPGVNAYDLNEFPPAVESGSSAAKEETTTVLPAE